MKFLPEWKKRVIRNYFKQKYTSCKTEYYSYGYDVECLEGFWLLKKITTTGKVVITYTEYTEAREVGASIAVFDNDERFMFSVRLTSYVRAIYGLEKVNYAIYINEKYIIPKFQLVGGMNYIPLCIYLNKEEYKDLLPYLRDKNYPPDFIKHVLLSNLKS